MQNVHLRSVGEDQDICIWVDKYQLIFHVMKNVSDKTLKKQ